MPKFIADFFPNVANYWDIFLIALTATYQMFFIAGLITLLIGGAFGISLIVTKTDGIKPNRIIHFILEVITNVFRAVIGNVWKKIRYKFRHDESPPLLH